MTNANPTEIKALTIIQPWATLIAIGAKTIETRSWRTDWRGTLAIHAAKGLPGWARDYALRDPACGLLERYGFATTHDLPRGAIVAVAQLVACVSTNDVRPDEVRERLRSDAERYNPEYELGDYSADRWLWLLDCVERINPPLPCSGKQRFWTPPTITAGSRFPLRTEAA
jgi:hypothetical protein